MGILSIKSSLAYCQELWPFDIFSNTDWIFVKSHWNLQYQKICISPEYVVECLTRDQAVARSSLTRGTALCQHFILCLQL